MLSLVSLVFFTSSALAHNFPWEGVQLVGADVTANPDVAFAKLPGKLPKAKCKLFPGDAAWPNTAKWSTFNSSVGGALIKGIPPAIVCYPGPAFDEAKCQAVITGTPNSFWLMQDPIIPYEQQWLGSPCPVPKTVPASDSVPQYSCNITSFPAYAVNATTVKHVQAAVNFARNNNIRLVIKNTGHDFLGRNTGGGALLVWTHYLKGSEYLPNLKFGKYNGQAVKVAAGIMQFEIQQIMEKEGITMLAPGSTTVGAYGGYLQGGGFGILSGRYGLMSDQVLSLEAVTADGRFVHADPYENEDLFWALRGGGPGNFAIATSYVVKAYPPISLTTTQINLETGFVNQAGFKAPASTIRGINDTVFWKIFEEFMADIPRITEVGGYGWNWVYTNPPNATEPRRFHHVLQINLSNRTAAEAKTFAEPLFQRFQAAGLNVTNPEPTFYATYAKQAFRPAGPGEVSTNGRRFGSREFPRVNFSNPTKFRALMDILKRFVAEGGYHYHSVDYSPTVEVAGWPGKTSAVNPAMRNEVSHSTGFDDNYYGEGVSVAQQKAMHNRLDSYLQPWRDVSPGAGAYMNEADVSEPNWKQSFYGANYGRLLRIKDDVDPWGLFYAITGVGSDRYTVLGTEGLPNQQGRLCRI
ncbi:FAD/FMN-containing isoamyl alcohol oxidase-like protein MreA [Amniculicola lignicola CBS 123094]|uniref:FAD/FMN-containing isoamyl alcohol oxidase-like protein MreA n=1 Tax=Amniculicola lignicola CBS 123094 TaxID=1392246 RepID=A0A6A5WCV8_9PLEO|nr:FAD/FMN-containing isoamyl alcohol oxidase-like protein MreA [Amniculicola lignicola CBS 123094]